MEAKDNEIGKIIDNCNKNDGAVKQAIYKLEGLYTDYSSIKDHLGNAYTIFMELLNGKPDPYDTNFNKRLEFKVVDLKLYVDFLFEVQDNDDVFDVHGIIVFGTTRHLRSFNFDLKSKNGDFELEPKDKLQDKALIRFTVNEQGHISSRDNYKDKVWKCDEKVDIADICSLALDGIIVDSFSWKNEKLTP